MEWIGTSNDLIFVKCNLEKTARNLDADHISKSSDKNKVVKEKPASSLRAAPLTKSYSIKKEVVKSDNLTIKKAASSRDAVPASRKSSYEEEVVKEDSLTKPIHDLFSRKRFIENWKNTEIDISADIVRRSKIAAIIKPLMGTGNTKAPLLKDINIVTEDSKKKFLKKWK